MTKKTKSSSKKKGQKLKSQTLFYLGWGLAALFLVLFIVSISTKSFTGANPEKLAKKAVDYLNENIFPNYGVLGEITSIQDEGSYVKVTLNITGASQPQQAVIYVLKDGKYMFVTPPIEIGKIPTGTGASNTGKEFSPPKTDKPNIKFFVMSFCPYGNQAEYALANVYNLLGDSVEWEPHYVIYPSSYYKGQEDKYCMGDYCSLHGIQELRQDIREVCIWRLYDHNTWWGFVTQVNSECSSTNADSCWKPIAEQLGIDTNKIEECLQNNATQILQEEYALNQKYGVRGSPTVFINDQLYNGVRTPNAYKNALCSAFLNPPDACNTELSQQRTQQQTAASCGG